VVWAFNKEDYFLIFLSILRKAVRMVREKDFRFLIEQTYPLEMLEHRNPELFADVEELITAGKIEMVDGQYLMPDPMTPGGEVLIREILLGKLYCKEKFGVDVPVAWAADGFGLNAQLPQIYKKSGYRWLAFRRGLPRFIGSRVSEFAWEGLDGTQILSHWMPLGYRAGLNLDRWSESYQHLKRLATTDQILMPCGSGGAIPQEDIPDRVRTWNDDSPPAEMKLAVPRDFFEALDGEIKDLVVYSGELYSEDMESIFPDVSSSRVRLRLAIRDCEHELLCAEKAATLAMIQGRAYPTELLSEAWRQKLFLAMHDVVPGCGIDEIYEEAWEYIGEMKRELPRETHRAVSHLMPGEGRSSHIVVFNPNSWDVENWVEADIELGEGWLEDPGISHAGKPVRTELVRAERWDDGSIRRATLGFVAKAPALGCAAYALAGGRKPSKNRMRVHDTEVESRFYKVRVDPRSGILQVTDHDGVPLVSGNELIIDEEVGDLYFHRSQLDQSIGSERGSGLRFGVFKPGPVEITRGAVRTQITFTNSYYCLRWPYYLIEKYEPLLYRHKTVDIQKKVILYDQHPRIDFETTLDLQQSHVRIRLRFDTEMITPAFARQTQFGVIDLPQDRTVESGHKIPSLTWINSQEGDRGLAFLARGVPIDEIKGGEVYCTLLRSVSVLSSDGISGPLIPTPEAQELGRHTYTYSVLPYTGDWRDACIHRRAYETSQPLRAFQVNREPRSTTQSYFRLEPEGLVLSALKMAEVDDGVILRFFETTGQPCRAKLQVPGQFAKAQIVDMLEREEQVVGVDAGSLELDVGPFEIVTLKLEAR
jgi:alpha-mannosidase